MWSIFPNPSATYDMRSQAFPYSCREGQGTRLDYGYNLADLIVAQVVFTLKVSACIYTFARIISFILLITGY